MKAQISGRRRQVSLEEEPALGRHGLVVAEQVLRAPTPSPLRLRALRDLRQLVRVAEEDEVARGRADRERVGERDLAGLVDEERVERTLASKSTPRARRATPCRRRAGGRRRAGRRRRSTASMQRPSKRDSLVVVASTSSRPLNAKPCSRPPARSPRSSLWIALWLSEVTPTRLPACISATAIFAPCHVLPEPGRALHEEVAVARASSAASTGSRGRARTAGSAARGQRDERR